MAAAASGSKPEPDATGARPGGAATRCPPSENTGSPEQSTSRRPADAAPTTKAPKTLLLDATQVEWRICQFAARYPKFRVLGCAVNEFQL